MSALTPPPGDPPGPTGGASPQDGPTDARGDDGDWRDAGSIERFQLDECTGVRLELDHGRKLPVVIVHHGDRYYALHDRCPHRGAPFSELGLVDDDGHLLCGWHYWSFRLDDGRHTQVDSVRVCTFPTRVDDGRLYVDVSRPPSGL